MAQATAGAGISGAVFDSLKRAPLVGAVVQIVAADAARFSRSATTDSLGRFALADVPDGRFAIGFLHPVLDSLGLEPPTREVVVQGSRPLTVDLAIPPAARIRAAICGPSADSTSGGVILGVVRNARDGAPVGQARVVSEWLELSLNRAGMIGRVPSVSDTTHENGWFALCSVPGMGTVTLTAARGDDSTDRFEIEIADGFARRELYVGSARSVGSDTLRQRVGEGRLRGQVIVAGTGNPLAGARVGIVDGPWTTANERGEWTLVGTPTGTRALQVRAVGYHPTRVSVDVVAQAPYIQTALSTMKAILDTVRITASRLTPEARGFEERRRSGLGRYLTQEDVARRQPLVTSDLLRSVAGVRVERAPDPIDGNLVLIRGVLTEQCVPAVYLDGQYLSDLSADDIDRFVHPDEIAGIEVYPGAWVPVQFTRGMTGVGRAGTLCGSIVIWTRPALSPLRRTSWLQRALTLVVVGVSAVMAGGMFSR